MELYASMITWPWEAKLYAITAVPFLIGALALVCGGRLTFAVGLLISGALFAFTYQAPLNLNIANAHEAHATFVHILYMALLVLVTLALRCFAEIFRKDLR